MSNSLNKHTKKDNTVSGFEFSCLTCSYEHGACAYHRSRGQEPPVPVHGIKDRTKPPAHSGLIDNFPRTLLEIAALSAYGITAELGRTPLDWKSVPDAIAVYSDAAMRHLLARRIDPGGRDLRSKFPHLTHSIWSLMAVRELELETLLDKNPASVV